MSSRTSIPEGSSSQGVRSQGVGGRVFPGFLPQVNGSRGSRTGVTGRDPPVSSWNIGGDGGTSVPTPWGSSTVPTRLPGELPRCDTTTRSRGEGSMCSRVKNPSRCPGGRRPTGTGGGRSDGGRLLSPRSEVWRRVGEGPYGGGGDLCWGRSK